MAKNALTEVTPTHDEIAAQAYQIYLREGCVAGRELDHWLQAEVELRTRGNSNGNGSANGNGNGHAEPTSRLTNPLETSAPAARGNTAPARRAGKR